MGSPVLGERVDFAGFQQKFHDFNVTCIQHKAGRVECRVEAKSQKQVDAGATSLPSAAATWRAVLES